MAGGLAPSPPARAVRSSAAAEVVELAAVPRRADGRVDLDAIVAALAPADLLESAPAHDGWSYVAPHLGARLTDDGTRSRWSTADGDGDAGPDPFAALDAWCAATGVDPHVRRDPGLPPFTHGLVGAFGYDLARRIEALPARARVDRDQPQLSLRVAEVVVAVPRDRDRALLCGRRLDRRGSHRRWRRAFEQVRERLAAATGDAAAPDPPPRAGPVTTSLPGRRYLAAVEAALERIAAGDAFQVNVTQRLTARPHLPLDVLHRRLRDASPAPHGACLPDVGIASVSPETFLAVADGRVTIRPVKGTRPRHHDPALDAAAADDLATSVKDRAENVMVVDLERNDLGRVATTGSVRVPRLCTVEAHPTVWHLVSQVDATLRPEVGYGGLLRATFPCGSITGAPKVAAMTIIEALEPVRRGWYCGAIGFLGPGAASLSVAIRTATRHPDGRVDHGAGGGIVADSDPAAELTESLDKAAAFLRAVDGRVRTDG